MSAISTTRTRRRFSVISRPSARSFRASAPACAPGTSASWPMRSSAAASWASCPTWSAKPKTPAPAGVLLCSNHMKERAEKGGVFRIEDPFKSTLNERLQMLVLSEKIDNAQAKIDQLVEAMATGGDPDFDQIPESIRAEVKAEWNEAR